MERNSNNRKKSKANPVALAIAAVVVIVLLILLLMPKSTEKDVNGTEGLVSEVVDGNTIKLVNGLTVDLIGVNETVAAKEFLEKNVKDKKVRLVVDSKDTKKTYKSPQKEKVCAYVNIMENTSFSNLNGYLLKNGLTGLNVANCNDSIEVFKSYVDSGSSNSNMTDNGPRVLLSEIDLSKKMTESTFLIYTLGEYTTSIGAGFFINQDGLAITNYHVLEDGIQYVAFLSDDQGMITSDRNRPLGRVIYADPIADFVVFTVTLDHNENVPYLSLAKLRPERGEKIGIVGHPRGQTATYASGVVSAIRESEQKIQVDISMDHGNSGGPICNMYGEVVSVAQSGMTSSHANLNFGVDVMVIREALDQLKDVKYYGGKN